MAVWVGIFRVLTRSRMFDGPGVVPRRTARAPGSSSSSRAPVLVRVGVLQRHRQVPPAITVQFFALNFLLSMFSLD